VLPADRPQARGGMDVVGALVGTAGLCFVVYATVRGHDQGWLSTATLAELAAAAALLAAFALRQRRVANPLVPRALARRSIVLGNVANAGVGGLLFGVFFVVIALYLQQVRGYSPMVAAGATVPASISLFVGSQLAGRLLARLAPIDLLGVGFTVQGVALAWWSVVLSPGGNIVTGFVLPAMLWCLGMGISLVGAFVVCTMGVTGPEGGAAAGLVNSTLQVGGAIGVAILTTIGAAAGFAAGSTAVHGYVQVLRTAVLLAALGLLTTLWLRRGQPRMHGHGHGPADPAATGGAPERTPVKAPEPA